jgi:hypothetical protein
MVRLPIKKRRNQLGLIPPVLKGSFKPNLAEEVNLLILEPRTSSWVLHHRLHRLAE